MFQWGKHLGVDKVKMLPDGNGEFTEKMGMLVKKENLGFGSRSWRYSMLVEDGQINKIFSEAGQEDNCPTDPFEVSDADTMLDYIKSTVTSRQQISAVYLVFRGASAPLYFSATIALKNTQA